MYAIIAHSGKQYHVKPGLKFNVEKMTQAVGDEVKLSDVLMVHDGKETQFGTPQVAGVAVLVRVIEHGLGDKVKIIKIKRRKHHMKRKGHRQSYTRLEVLAIGDPKTVKAPKAAAVEKKPTDKSATTAKASKKATAKPAKDAAEKKSPAKKADKKPVTAKGSE